MEAQLWHRVKDVVASALELDAEQRSAFVVRACTGDEELRARVLSLLEPFPDDTSFLQGAPIQLAAEAPSDHPPERIGRYRIRSELGRGGMGTVYRATRESDRYQNEVAIKVLRAGWDDPHLRHRFLFEGEILSRLRHSWIARLIEGGMTSDGRPFLVMELIDDGLPICGYCDHHRLDLDQRLKLMLEVSEAVRFAHSNLVVHRDLKPSNILITPEGEPRLLDFGIAKLVDVEGHAAAGGRGHPRTATGLNPMTPEYAAPEQVSGRPITTATDVYALGILLYELLCGRHPHQLTDPDRIGLVRTVCELEPPRPSQALARAARPELSGARQPEDGPPPDADPLTALQIAWCRRTDPRRLRRALEGDLDCIVLKALRKDPGQRYRSVERLMEDLERYRRGEPVLARRGHLGYRLAKLTRRHLAPITIGTVFILTLISFAAAMTAQRVRVAHERDRAEQVTKLLIETFEASDPVQAKGEELSVRDLLDRASARLEHELADDPLLQAELLATLGKVYISLAMLDSAEPLIERALALRRLEAGPSSYSTGISLDLLGTLRQEQGRYEEAERLHRQALEIVEGSRGGRKETLPDVTSHLAGDLWYLARLEESELLYQQALELYLDAGAGEEENVAQIQLNLSAIRSSAGDHRQALELAEQALSTLQASTGERHPSVATALDSIATEHRMMGDLDTAEQLYRRSLAIRRQVFEISHPEIAHSLNSIALVLKDKGLHDQAEPMYRESLEMARQVWGHEHGNVTIALSNLAVLLNDQGDPLAAEPLLREALEIRQRTAGAHPSTAAAMGNLASVLETAGKIDEAEVLQRAALTMRRSLLGERHPHVAASLHNLGSLQLRQGRPEQAETLVRQALDISREALGPECAPVAASSHVLAKILLELDQGASAEPFARQAVSIRRSIHGAEHAGLGLSQVVLARALVALGRCQEAKMTAQEAMSILGQRSLGSDLELLEVMTKAIASCGPAVPSAAARQVPRDGSYEESL